MNLVKAGNFFVFSFVIKHLNFIALPPSAIPSLNSGAPPTIALVPSYSNLRLLRSGISALIISLIASLDNGSFNSQCLNGIRSLKTKEIKVTSLQDI
jgi:hypothetical protein